MRPFIGYAKELALVRKCLASSENRLLILTGIVGSGKSRLAVEVAWAEAPNFRDGVYYIDLEQVKAGEVLTTIARALIPEWHEAHSITRQLAGWLRNKEMLLILDHFDHLVHSDAHALGLLTPKAPELHIVVTSQERLKLRSETCLEIQGLDYPATTDATRFEAYDAIRFFIQRVRRWQPDFALTAAEDREAILRICHHTGGIPRALELYAYAVNFFPLNQIIPGSENYFGWGELLSRDVSQRQRSLQHMFDCSWKQLAAEEQQALVSLSVFNTSFSLPAAQAITQVHPAMLLSLLAKSWLQLRCSSQIRATQVSNNRHRHLPSGCYRIPNFFHFYTSQMLQQDSALLTILPQAHASYYMNFLRQHMDKLINGRYQIGILRAIRSEVENIDQAWGWTIDQQLHEARAQLEHDLSLFYVMENRYLRSEKASMMYQVAYARQNVSSVSI